MPLRSDAYFRQLAEKALADCGASEPPVSMYALADHYGIPVRLADMPSFFRGATIYEDGLPVLIVNGSLEDFVRQATLAHMLGHVLIVLDDPGYTYPRNLKLEHPEADAVAEELLTPAFMVKAEAQKWFNDHRYLAGLFGVAENDMMERMLDLGIIEQRGGIMWEY